MPDFLKQFGAARFGVMAGVAAVLTAFFLYIAGAITEPAKTILFSGLESRDAAAVSQKLDAMAVPYEVKDGGTILVPSDQVTRLRMALAQDNLPAAGVGYEIFDKSDTFGATAFTQNVNRLRAMEGELARSIQTIEGIQSARVHLVIPERQVFARDNQTPSASVVVRTRARMDRGQVGAVQHMVAAAVAGLSAKRVAIIDDAGNLLAGGDGGTGAAATAAEHDQQVNDYEERLRNRIESLVSSVVGIGRVRTQVTAEMKFDNITTTSEQFDPESRVVRSSQTVERNASDASGGAQAMSVANALPGQAQAGGGGADRSTSGSTEETTNYEINKTVTTSTNDGGTVKRLSVAVVVDSAGDGKAPRSAAEMTQIEALVKSAMGFDAARGDQIQVKNMAFARLDAGPTEAEEAPLLGLDSAQWFKIIEAAILCLTALLIALFVLRPLINRVFAAQNGDASANGALALAAASPVAGALPAPSTTANASTASGALPAPEGAAPPARPGIDLSQMESQFGDNSIKKVGEVVSQHPEEALSIIRTWLHQPV